MGHPERATNATLPSEMKDAWRRHRAEHLSLVLRSMRSDYNCVGLVFASRRAALEIDDVQRILADDGYRRIQLEDGQRGDLVLYKDAGGPAHIGILWDSDPSLNSRTVLSQWGLDGEYFHGIFDIRDDWRHEVSIWTERLTFK